MGSKILLILLPLFLLGCKDDPLFKRDAIVKAHFVDQNGQPVSDVLIQIARSDNHAKTFDEGSSDLNGDLLMTPRISATRAIGKHQFYIYPPPGITIDESALAGEDILKTYNQKGSEIDFGTITCYAYPTVQYQIQTNGKFDSGQSINVKLSYENGQTSQDCQDSQNVVTGQFTSTIMDIGSTNTISIYRRQNCLNSQPSDSMLYQDNFVVTMDNQVLNISL